MYLRAAKTDAESAGESTDGMASSISELRGELLKLTGNKVDIQLDNNTFKSTYQILKELSEVWNQLDDTSHANILEMVGGKRNANVVAAILENFSVAEEAMATAADSAGSALEENEKFLDSIQGKLNILKATFEDFSQSLLDSEFLKGALDVITGLVKGLDFLVDKLGALATIGGISGAIWGVKNIKNIKPFLDPIAKVVGSASGIKSTAYIGTDGLFDSGTVNAYRASLTGLSAKQSEVALSTLGLNAAQKKQILTSGASTAANTSQAISFKVLGNSILACVKAMLTSPVGWAIIAAAAITGIIAYNKHLEEARQKLIETGKEASQLTSDLDKLVNQYQKLTEDGFDASDREQALNIQEQINELLDGEVKNLNLANGNYKEQLELLRQIQLEKARDTKADKRDAKTAAEQSLQKIAIGDVDAGTWRSSKENSAIERLLEDNGMGKYVGSYHGSDQYRFFEIDRTDVDSIIESYEDMIKLRNILAESSYEEEISSGGVLEDFYNNLRKKINDMSDAVSDYKDAIKNYNLNEAVIKFNEEEFGNTKGALIKSKEELTTWTNALLNSKDVSDEIKANLIGLAQTYYPSLNDSLKEIINTYITQTSKEWELEEVTEENIGRLIEYGKQAGFLEKDILSLISTEIIFNNTKLDIKDKLKALKELASQAGLTATALMAATLSRDDAAYNNFIRRKTNQGMSIEEAQEQYLQHLWQQATKVSGGTPTGNPDPPKEDPKSATDKPETKTFTPEKYDYDKEYYDNYDEVLEDKQKAREGHDDVISALEKDLDDAVESGDISRAQEISGRIKEANDNHVALLKKQKNDEEYQLNNELLPAIYEIAPELQGKTRDEMSDAEIENVRRRLEDNIQAEENKLVDEKNRINKEINDIENAWEQESYDLKIANGNKETEAYKAREAEVNSQIDALKAELDGLSDEGVKTAEFTLDKFDSLIDTSADYAEDIKDIGKDIEESVENTEDNTEKVKDSINNAFDEYQRHIDRTTKALEEQAEAYDILINKGQTLVDAERKMYDAQASVREIQRDIAKELRTNKAMSEYLDEETRKRLFNEDDYNTLDKKLTGISEDIGEINAWYNAEISKLTEDNWYLESAITAEYERRLESKQKEYEIARAELDLEKKKLELNNILNERNIRMLTKNDDGSYEWKYVHNTEEASRVVGEIADLEEQIAETRLQAEQDATLAIKQAKVDQLNAEQAAINNQIDQINKHTEALSQAVEDITNPLQDFGSIVSQLNSVLETEITALDGVFSSVTGGTSTVISTVSGSSGTSKTGGTFKWASEGKKQSVDIPMGSTAKESIKIANDIKNEAIAKRDALLNSGAGKNEKLVQTYQKIIDKAERRENTLKSYVDDSFDHGGIAEGKGFMFKDTNLDELVLDPQQTNYFKNFVKNMDGFDVTADIMSKMIKNIPSSTMMQKYTPSETYEFNGDIVLPNVTRPEDFMKELKRSLQQNSFKK